MNSTELVVSKPNPFDNGQCLSYQEYRDNGIRNEVITHIIHLYMMIKKICYPLPYELCIVILNNFEFKCTFYDCSNRVTLNQLHSTVFCNSVYDDWNAFQDDTSYAIVFNTHAICVCNDHHGDLFKCIECYYIGRCDWYETYNRCYQCYYHLCLGCTIHVETYKEEVLYYCKKCHQSLLGEKRMFMDQPKLNKLKTLYIKFSDTVNDELICYLKWKLLMMYNYTFDDDDGGDNDSISNNHKEKNLRIFNKIMDILKSLDHSVESCTVCYDIHVNISHKKCDCCGSSKSLCVKCYDALVFNLDEDHEVFYCIECCDKELIPLSSLKRLNKDEEEDSEDRTIKRPRYR